MLLGPLSVGVVSPYGIDWIEPRHNDGMTYFIATGFTWEPGEVIGNDTFKDSPHKTFFVETVPPHLIDVPDYLARRGAEAALEHVRGEHFAGAPSRAVAIFLNTTAEAARLWTTKTQRQDYAIYELSVLNREASAETNYTWFNYLVRLHSGSPTDFLGLFSSDPESEADRVAEAYWRNEPTELFNEVSRSEYLFVGSLEVITKID